MASACRGTVQKLRSQCPKLLFMQLMRVDASEVNQKLEQCADDCVTKLLYSTAVRNQDRSARRSIAEGLWGDLELYRKMTGGISIRSI